MCKFDLEIISVLGGTIWPEYPAKSVDKIKLDFMPCKGGLFQPKATPWVKKY